MYFILSSFLLNYNCGDFVLIKNQTGTKLDCVYEGPYKVMEEISPNVKIIKNNKVILVHKNNTKLFHS